MSQPKFIPSSAASLRNQVLRANLVSSMWENSWKPETNGWKLVVGQYEMDWYDCSQLLKSLCECSNVPLEIDKDR